MATERRKFSMPTTIPEAMVLVGILLIAGQVVVNGVIETHAAATPTNDKPRLLLNKSRVVGYVTPASYLIVNKLTPVSICLGVLLAAYGAAFTRSNDPRRE